MNKLSSGAALSGIQTPETGRNSNRSPREQRLRHDQAAPPGAATDKKVEGGLDVKMGITDGVTADVTYNTDSRRWKRTSSR